MFSIRLDCYRYTDVSTVHQMCSYYVENIPDSISTVLWYFPIDGNIWGVRINTTVGASKRQRHPSN